MSFGEILYALLIKPIQLLFEIIYGVSYLLTNNYALAIIVLSICVNFLVLPLYRRADEMQEEERAIERKLADGVAHIKKTFKGDERMMMLQTYYRQNNYKPIYALRGATSLVLQIPFFIAAFRFLSSYTPLQGVSFGLIHDLSKPDGIVNIAGLSINILPIIMTAINLISSRIYSRDLQLKDKIQLYGTALVFLVLLYKSPAGLVFYWTLNNAFSLLKTIVFKTKDRKKTVAIICSVLSVAVFTVALITALRNSEYDTALLFLLALFLQYPFAVYYIGKRFAKKKSVSEKKTSHTGNVRTNPKLFFLAGLFLSVLCGLTIPSNIIKASPLEFTFSNYSFNPLWYLVSSGCIAFGTFVIWLGVFYWLSSEKKKIAFELFYVGISGFATLSYFLLGKNLGTLTSSLSYLSQSTLNYPNVEKIISVAILLALITLLALFYVKFIEKRKFFMPLIASGCLALCILSATNVQGIHSELSTYNAKTISSTNVKIPLSKTERNIAIIMLDRAMGAYVPYIFNEKPTLKEQFSGFTYYSNVISFGRSTNFGAPPLFGGYEYTPVEMNSRKGESLKDKNNEAISVLPRIFGENGYHITYINPVYANYYYKSELSVFEPYPYITASVIDELSSDTTLTENNIHNNFRNFYLYSVMRTLPIFLQPLVYDGGNYYINNNTQRLESPYRAIGNRDTFLKAYSILQNLSSITETNNSNGEVLIMTNNTTHDIQLLQEPAYEPRDRVDNEKYDLMHTNRFTVNNRTLKMKNHKHYTHYQCNVAALMRLGEWFDFLRANDVYDNTKIIIVSDHGYGTDMEQLKELIIEEGNSALSDAEAYFPLLMIKDYNSKGFSVSNEFMTNADVPTIALEGAVENPVNPFTQKPINSKEKFAHKQYIIASYDFDIAKNNGNQFNPSMWYSVQDSIWEHKNWERVADKAVLTNDDINE